MGEVCIIGSLNTEVIVGPVEALPGWGRQVFAPHVERRNAGSAPSVAYPLARMGVGSVIVGTVGEDAAGRDILNELTARGLCVDAVRRVPGRPTGICVSLYRAQGERQYISSLASVAETTAEMLTNEAWHFIQRCDLILLTGLFVLQGLGIAGAAEVFEQVKRDGKTTLLDTGWDVGGWSAGTLRALRGLLAVTDVFLPSLSEAQAIAGPHELPALLAALRAFGAQRVIVKLGRDGAAGDWGSGFVCDPGFPRDVRDTTAAGEAFNAGVLYSLLSGFDLKETLRFANAAASLFLAKEAADYPTLAEIRALLRGCGKGNLADTDMHKTRDEA